MLNRVKRKFGKFLMLNSMKPLLVAAIFAVATNLSAQEATTTEAPAADAAATETPVADAPAVEVPAADAAAAEAPADLSMGSEVAAAPAAADENAVGTPYIRETQGDWSVRCLRAAPGEADPCQLYQLLQDTEGNSVAEISMFALPEGSKAAAGATIVVPLETLLTEQLQISVDGASTRRYPFTFCNRAGCVARVGFTQDEVNQFKRGNAASVRMVPAAAPTEEVVLKISLAGFTAGYEAASK